MAEYLVSHMIGWLEKQIEAIPSLTISDDIPGSGAPQDIWQETILDRLNETMNRARDIQELKSLEGGRRRYCTHVEAARIHLEPVKDILAEAVTLQSARYADGEQRQKALARLKDRPAKIVAACKAAIAELQAALRLLEEGDRKSEQAAARAR